MLTYIENSKLNESDSNQITNKRFPKQRSISLDNKIHSIKNISVTEVHTRTKCNISSPVKAPLIEMWNSGTQRHGSWRLTVVYLVKSTKQILVTGNESARRGKAGKGQAGGTRNMLWSRTHAGSLRLGRTLHRLAKDWEARAGILCGEWGAGVLLTGEWGDQVTGNAGYTARATTGQVGNSSDRKMPNLLIRFSPRVG